MTGHASQFATGSNHRSAHQHFNRSRICSSRDNQFEMKAAARLQAMDTPLIAGIYGQIPLINADILKNHRWP